MSVPTAILLTNDDGIEAPGLRAFESALRERPGVELWVAAPDRERSTCGHGMTLDRPLRAIEAGERRAALDGTPADCVYWALFGWMPRRPQVVVSGINKGGNLGTDVIYSGTVAGAREGAIRGVHGVAASLVEGESFEEAAASAAEIASAVARLRVESPLLLNLNYPAGAFGGPRLAEPGSRDYPEEVRRVRAADGSERHWLGGPPVRDRRLPGSDGWLVERGVAAATALKIEPNGAAGAPSIAERLGIAVDRVEQSG